MEIVVGVNQGDASRDALKLGAALATSLDAKLVITNIYPVAYGFPSKAHVDAEWQAFLIERGQETLDWARVQIGDRGEVEYSLHGHRSSGIGLIEVAENREASMIVLGSSPGGSPGRIHCGSTADQLMHGSPVSVATAPHGYRDWAPTAFERAVVAYQRTSESDRALDLTVAALHRPGLEPCPQICLVTIVERVTRIYGSRLGANAEDQVLAALHEQAHEAQGLAVKRLESEGFNVSTAVLQGDNVGTALAKFDWNDADLLVLGSTDIGPLRRVLLGDMTYKLLRASPAPTVVIPRS